MAKLLIEGFMDGKKIYRGELTPEGDLTHETDDVQVAKGWSLQRIISRCVRLPVEYYAHGTFPNAAAAADAVGLEAIARQYRKIEFGISLKFAQVVQ